MGILTASFNSPWFAPEAVYASGAPGTVTFGEACDHDRGRHPGA
jgi:hypothetical protein